MTQYYMTREVYAAYCARYIVGGKIPKARKPRKKHRVPDFGPQH